MTLLERESALAAAAWRQRIARSMMGTDAAMACTGDSTRREREALELVCSGHTNAEIARRLFLSVKTVDHHVSAVLAKLGATTRRDAAAKADRLGLASRARTTILDSAIASDPASTAPTGGPRTR